MRIGQVERETVERTLGGASLGGVMNVLERSAGVGTRRTGVRILHHEGTVHNVRVRLELRVLHRRSCGCGNP